MSRTLPATLFAPMLAALVLVPVAGAADDGVPPRAIPDSPLAAYFRIAAANNPGLRARYEEWRAALQESARIRGLPDPTVSYGVFLQSVETALGPQEHRIAIQQRIPWFGKLGLRGDAAEKDAHAAERRYEAERLRLLETVASEYYELAYLEESIAVTQESFELIQYQEGVARARYRTGTSSHPDLIKAQVELGVIEDRLQTLRDQRGPRRAALNAALGRDAHDDLPWAPTLEPPPFEAPDDAQVIEAVLAANPGLLSLDQKIEGSRRRVDAARRDRYPDFALGLETVLIGASDFTMFDPQGRDAWMASISINLPLWRGKYTAAIRQAGARQRAAEAAREDERNRLGAATEHSLFQLRDARRKARLYEDSLIPKAEESIRATSAAFQTGEATFLDFLDAQRVLLRFQLDLARAQADRGRQAIAIAALMGYTLPGTEETPGGPTP